MVLRGIGRVFITVGLLVLAFLGYQVFGTNLVTGQHQEALAQDLKKSFVTPTAAPGPRPQPKDGEGIGLIKIPKVNVESVFVEGVEVEDLKKGPGHYKGTAFPGEAGNVVISGHRTTYGAPFYRLDELQSGDLIELVDGYGTYRYQVTEKKIVAPTDLSVITESTESKLTLTTCHPRYSAKQRLIIVAELQGSPKDA